MWIGNFVSWYLTRSLRYSHWVIFGADHRYSGFVFCMLQKLNTAVAKSLLSLRLPQKSQVNFAEGAVVWRAIVSFSDAFRSTQLVSQDHTKWWVGSSVSFNFRHLDEGWQALYCALGEFMMGYGQPVDICCRHPNGCCDWKVSGMCSWIRLGLLHKQARVDRR